MVNETFFVVNTTLLLDSWGDLAVKIKFKIFDYEELQEVGKQFLVHSPKYGALAVVPLWEQALKDMGLRHSVRLVGNTLKLKFFIASGMKFLFKFGYKLMSEEKYKEFVGCEPIKTDE